ncbi:FtsX-like permease family protein [Rhodopirellula sp. MGV]|uniref:FtsX-like permease family protein n=2 Tax=Rhodopirellula sp. MGV TaxID=2023130 RepID=UPI000B96A9AD|nr:ABC transporter permease [Rhodopirellula sp. MGV]OYP39232.1 ABC transporter permease [Rhodopirellula sp. MGV]PNY35428.1 ABC transporter permease [Rhodopirellula baltica]
MIRLRFITKLVTSQMRLHPGRVVITALGVIASTCALVWVVSGYDALVSHFDENAGKYLGRYDVLVMGGGGPPGAPKATIKPELIEALQQDAGVLEVNPVSSSRVSATRVKRENDKEDPESSLGLLIGNRPPVNGAPPVGPTLVGTPAISSPYELVDGKWLGGEDQVAAAVVGEDVAKDMKLSVGDSLLVTTFGNQVELELVGIIEQAPQAPSLGGGGRGRGPRGGGGQGRGGQGRGGPGRSGPDRKGRGGPEQGGPTKQMNSVPKGDEASTEIGLPGGFSQGVPTNAIYVRPVVADRINGFTVRPEVLQIAIRDAVSVEQFREVWDDKLAANRPPLKIIDFAAVREGMESGRSISGQQSQAWAATGMASLAAIFIIFSTLSMGVSERAREFAMLRAVALTRSQIAGIIAIESIVLAFLGWIGGLLAGWLMVLIGSRILPGLFSSGAMLGWTSLSLSAITVLVGATAAAILPAWRAMRIKPLDAMSTRPKTPSPFWWIVFGVIGLVLSAITPITVFALPMSDEWRTWCYSFVTYPMLLLGMILLAPAVVVGCERVLGPVVTGLMRLDQRMMKTQLSSNLWRSVGATLALSVGLGLYASTQTWGYSMLVPFTPGEWLPDALVAFHPVGLTDEDAALVPEVDGVKSSEVMELAIEQAKFDWEGGEPPSRLRFGDNGVVCGLDAARAFGGEHPFLSVNFVEGTAESAIDAINNGNGCVVSQDFVMATGLTIGDEVPFLLPADESQRATYKIAGVVSLPGWQWVTKFSGVRRHFVRTGAILFANHDRVHSDFRLKRTEFFWVNFDDNVNLESVEAQFQAIAERRSGETFLAEGVGTVKAYRPFARMTATSNVKKAIQLRADGMIWGMSYLPLVTLAIMSLAIANTVIASVRARTWEFGVMRSIGVSRSQLVRLVFAETSLIALSACLLSLFFGLVAGWCGVGMAQFGGWFAGPPSFMIPWGQLAIGFAMTLLLCLLAGLWPAIKTGRSEPLRLLQSGRAAS